MVYMRVPRQLILECSIQGISLLREVIPVQASMGKPATESGDRDHNQSWAQMGKIPSSSILIFIPEETVDWNSNALPEGVYLNN